MDHYESVELLDCEDAVLSLRELRFTLEGSLDVPNRGRFALNDWSKRQLATLTGIRFDRWFENAWANERADEMNRRFDRADFQVRGSTTSISTVERTRTSGTGVLWLSRPRASRPSASDSSASASSTGTAT